MECKELLVSWLKNAYAMEKGMVETIKEHIEDAKDDPDMESAISKMEEHVDESEMQAERVKSAIEKLGSDISSVKTNLTTAQQKATSASLDMFKDHGVKNIIIDHASEHFEMATYMAISKAAKMCNQEEIAQMAEEIMKKESQTAEKLKNEIEKAVESYFEKNIDTMEG